MEKIIDRIFKKVEIDNLKRAKGQIDKEIEHVNKVLEGIASSINKFFYWLMGLLIAYIISLSNSIITKTEKSIQEIREIQQKDNNTSKIEIVVKDYNNLVETISAFFHQNLFLIVMLIVGFFIFQVVRRNMLIKYKNELLKTYQSF